MSSRSASSTIGIKRSHASASHPSAVSSLSLTDLASDSPPDSPSGRSPPAPPPFTRSPSSLRLIRSHIPHLYDFFYELSMDWPFYTMCWGLPLPPSSDSFNALSPADRRHYSMQRLYYAQSTDASYDPYWNRFVGNPHTLVEAEMPLPSRPCIADMLSAATGEAAILEDVYCSYITDCKKLAHPGEINRIKLCHQRDRLVLTHTDSPRVYVWDFATQPNKHVKVNCRPHVPDVQLLGHYQGEGASHPMYFALDTAAKEARVISGGPDQQVCVWGLDDYVTSLAGKETVVAEGGKGTTSALLQAREVYAGHTACVEDVCFHPFSADIFASVGDDRLLLLWDARVEGGGGSTLVTGHTDDVNAVSWNPINEHLLLTASSDRLIHLIDLRKRSSAAVTAAAQTGAAAADHAVVHAFAGHEREVKNVQWAPNGVHFASAGDDAVVNVWSCQQLPEPPDGPLPPSVSPSPLHRAYYQALPGAEPALVFRHSTHPSAVQFFQWNPHHSPYLTMASIHGDTGGQMQIWRMNEQLYGDVEEANAETKEWRRERKKADEARREKEKGEGEGRGRGRGRLGGKGGAASVGGANGAGNSHHHSIADHGKR